MITNVPVLDCPIREEFLKILDSYKEEIDTEGRNIIKSRINQINQITNRDKLLIPFR